MKISKFSQSVKLISGIKQNWFVGKQTRVDPKSMSRNRQKKIWNPIKSTVNAFVIIFWQYQIWLTQIQTVYSGTFLVKRRRLCIKIRLRELSSPRHANNHPSSGLALENQNNDCNGLGSIYLTNVNCRLLPRLIYPCNIYHLNIVCNSLDFEKFIYFPKIFCFEQN